MKVNELRNLLCEFPADKEIIVSLDDGVTIQACEIVRVESMNDAPKAAEDFVAIIAKN